MHKEHCLLYESGEMDPASRAEFEGHLSSCEGCRDWLKAIRKAHAWAEAVKVPPPAQAVSEAMRRGPQEPPAGGGGIMKGLMSFLLVSGLVSGGIYMVQRATEPAEAPEEQGAFAPAPVHAPEIPLHAIPPKRDAQLAGSVPAGSFSLAKDSTVAEKDSNSWTDARRAASATRAAFRRRYPPPQLDCRSPQSILEFKTHVYTHLNPSRKPGEDEAVLWSRCLCGEPVTRQALQAPRRSRIGCRRSRVARRFGPGRTRTA